ncbi:MAG: homoserine kinase [Bacteroidia bacterium]
MKKNKITVFAPATVANLACGFDVMGLAVDAPGDEVTVEMTDKKEVRVKTITGDGGRLSKAAEKNTASVAIIALNEDLHIDQGFDITIRKKMPLGSGLGSSAASAVAGVFAANELLGRPFSRQELVPFAMMGEKMACGAAHADNVAPSMLGGIVLIRSYNPLDIISLPVPENLAVAVVHPHVEVLTRDARAVIPKKIDLHTGIAQWANTAALTAGLFSSDYDLIARSVVDMVAEPNRAKLIPCFDQVKETAYNEGALACSISGSGPSIFALCEGMDSAKHVASKMKRVFTGSKIKSDVFVSFVNTKGARIVKQ